MKAFSNYLYNKSTWSTGLVFTILMVAYASIVMGGFSKCFTLENSALNSLGLGFGFTQQEVYEFFSLRSTEMLLCYRNFILIWDNIFPLVYGLMYAIWVSVLFKDYRQKVSILNLLPVIHILFDWFENFFEIQLVSSYLDSGSFSASLVQLGSISSMIKWTLSYTTYLILLIGIFLRIRNRILKKA